MRNSRRPPQRWAREKKRKVSNCLLFVSVLNFLLVLFLTHLIFLLLILLPCFCSTGWCKGRCAIAGDRHSVRPEKKKQKVSNCLLFVFVSKSLLLFLLICLIFFLLVLRPYFYFTSWCDGRRRGEAQQLVTQGRKDCDDAG